MTVEIRVGPAVEADAMAVRRAVFVEEQGVPAELEVDEHDETATHVAAYDGGDPIGAARLRDLDETTGKVERVAVRAPYRGQGVGTDLMAELEATARQQGFQRLTMHSQLQAAPFYDRLGYERVGEPFEEAGIPHVEMTKRL